MNGTITTTARPSRWWNRLLDWTPTDEQLKSLGSLLECFDKAGRDVLLWAVILTGVYLAFEIGTAFLPGGPVEHVLKGLQ